LKDIRSALDGVEVVQHYRPAAPKQIRFGLPHAGYGYWVQVLGVEVDMLTGEVAVIEVENYLDTGQTINPLGVLGQCEGAFAQGLGYALYENAIYENGRMRNASFADYIVPLVKDVPSRLTIHLFETPDNTNPLGVRGIAEIGLTPVAASVANAIHDAIGIRFDRFPILPEMVLEAIARGEDERRA
jgi:CO/xanthine dehydrogenase Mo-binding subunit